MRIVICGILASILASDMSHGVDGSHNLDKPELGATQSWYCKYLDKLEAERMAKVKEAQGKRQSVINYPC